MIVYPEGRRRNRAYQLQLSDPWRFGTAREAQNEGGPAASASEAEGYGDTSAEAYQRGEPAVSLGPISVSRDDLLKAYQRAKGRGGPVVSDGVTKVSSIMSLQAYQQRDGAGEEQGDVSGERASETAESVPAENGVATSFPVGFGAEAYQQNGTKRASEEGGVTKTPSPSPSPSLSPAPPIPSPTPTPSPSDSFAPLRSTKESAAAGAGGDQANEEAGKARKRREPERPRGEGQGQGELLPSVAAEAEQIEAERRKKSLHRFVTLLSELGLDGTMLTGKAYAKQAAVLGRMIEAHGHDDVETAMRGMGGIYPFSSGDPWDALTLERRFVEALASGRKIERAKLSGDVSALPEPERARARAQRAEEERRRIAEDEEAHRAAVAAWRERISERLAAEERDVKLRFWKEAERAYDDLPLRVDDSKRRAFIVELALANYGAAVGDPPPRLERSR